MGYDCFVNVEGSITSDCIISSLSMCLSACRFVAMILRSSGNELVLLFQCFMSRIRTRTFYKKLQQNVLQEIAEEDYVLAVTKKSLKIRIAFNSTGIFFIIIECY